LRAQTRHFSGTGLLFRAINGHLIRNSPAFAPESGVRRPAAIRRRCRRIAGGSEQWPDRRFAAHGATSATPGNRRWNRRNSSRRAVSIPI